MTAAPIRAPTPLGFSRILLATEFSACSEHALACALAIARAYRSHLYILHVLHPDQPIPESGYGPGMVDADRWSAEKRLRRLGNSQALAGVPHTPLLKTGRLWEVADRIIHGQEIDLVVVGCRGRGGLEKVFIGSHAEDICRHASCPVLVVGPRAQAPAKDFTLQRILFATAYHAGSLHALAYAYALAERYQAELTLFHALRVDDFSSVGADELLAQTREQLRRLSSQPVGFRVSALAQPCVSPAASILNLAQETGAELIVLGIHARSIALATHLPWNTVHQVTCGAHCPVLTVAGG